MSNGLSLRALLDYIHNDDINGLKGFLINKHVQVNNEFGHFIGKCLACTCTLYKAQVSISKF